VPRETIAGKSYCYEKRRAQLGIAVPRESGFAREIDGMHRCHAGVREDSGVVVAGDAQAGDVIAHGADADF
jgi:hypothetical protein